jgi:hypothetical protein
MDTEYPGYRKGNHVETGATSAAVELNYPGKNIEMAY